MNFPKTGRVPREGSAQDPVWGYGVDVLLTGQMLAAEFAIFDGATGKFPPEAEDAVGRGWMVCRSASTKIDFLNAAIVIRRCCLIISPYFFARMILH